MDGVRWKFWIHVNIPGVKEPQHLIDADVPLDKSGQPTGQLSFLIDKRVTKDHAEHRVDIDGLGMSITEYAVREAEKKFAADFKRPPSDMGGSLMDDNKLIFQREYIKELQKGASPERARAEAIMRTPFGKGRWEAGYKEIVVEPPKEMTKMVFGNPPKVYDVPKNIHVSARKP
jgi:hypothetical protein